LIKKTNDANIIGFYILKRVKRWDIEKYFKDAKDFNDRQKKYDIARKQMTKDKAIAVDKEGYDKYFLLDGKKMKVENFDLTEAKVNKGTTSELKRIFGKSMANRLVSRVVLNKFIQEVA
jgi:DNA topoisomerase IB